MSVLWRDCYNCVTRFFGSIVTLQFGDARQKIPILKKNTVKRPPNSEFRLTHRKRGDNVISLFDEIY